MKPSSPNLKPRHLVDLSDTTSILHSPLILLLSKNNPYLLLFNFLIHLKIRINVTFKFLTTLKTNNPFPSSKIKRTNLPKHKVAESNATSATASITNDNSTILSFFSLDDFLKMLVKKCYIQRGYRSILQERSRRIITVEQQCNDGNINQNTSFHIVTKCNATDNETFSYPNFLQTN